MIFLGKYILFFTKKSNYLSHHIYKYWNHPYFIWGKVFFTKFYLLISEWSVRAKRPLSWNGGFYFQNLANNCIIINNGIFYSFRWIRYHIRGKRNTLNLEKTVDTFWIEDIDIRDLFLLESALYNIYTIISNNWSDLKKIRTFCQNLDPQISPEKFFQN